MAMPQWSSPWPADATKDGTLSALRSAYPKSTAFGAAIYPDMAFALVRGQAGFAPATVFGVDVEMDNLAYVRMNWSRF
jgi:hypothetical protein